MWRPGYWWARARRCWPRRWRTTSSGSGGAAPDAGALDQEVVLAESGPAPAEHLRGQPVEVGAKEAPPPAPPHCGGEGRQTGAIHRAPTRWSAVGVQLIAPDAMS